MFPKHRKAISLKNSSPVRLRTTIVTIAVCLLISCGGGSGDNAPQSPPTNPPPVLQAQSIAFVTPGPVSKQLSDPAFSNIASGGAGSGGITYSSSDSSIARVNASSGEVTVLTPGTVQISATKAADATYQSATSTYSLTVVAPPSVPLFASIGAQDTQIRFPIWTQGLEFLRSTDPNCVLASVQGCANGQQSTLAASPLTDQAVNLSRDGWYWLRRGATFGRPAKISRERFINRTAAAATSFQGKLWLIGGQGGDIALRNDVWSSVDGQTWDLVTADAGFPVRAQHQLLAFNNRLWVIAGNGSGPLQRDVFRNDVWSSADGVTWRQEAAAAAFPGRIGNATVVFNNRMWVIGGFAPGSSLSADVWSSSDGVTWTLVTANGGFGSYSSNRAVEFNGRIWLFVRAVQSETSEVWSSADGANWTRSSSGAFPVRDSPFAAVLNGRLWMFGGERSNRYFADVWSSADGVTWTESTRGLLPSGRWGTAAAVHAGRMYMIGGQYAPAAVVSGRLQLFYYGDVWSSGDGENWTNNSPYAPYYEGSPLAVSHSGALVAIAPGGDLAPRPAAWSSADGIDWSTPVVNLAFPRRNNAALVSFNNRVWLIGGERDGTKLNDVWSSPNGRDWASVTSAAAFVGRTGHRVVAFNNQLLLIGGATQNGLANDVWTSSDGAAWVQVTTAAPFSPRTEFGLAVAGGRLWLVGGLDATGQQRDAWVSTDGVQWLRVNEQVPTLPAAGFSLASHNGNLWLTGGVSIVVGNGYTDVTYKNEVWSSTDAVNWRRVSPQAAFSPRFGSTLVSLESRLFLLGGIDANGVKNDVWSSTDGSDWRLGYRGAIPYPQP
jgi:N-acetylneuraminic acid mutarotase